MVREECALRRPGIRLAKLLGHLGIACSNSYARPAAEPQRPGRKPKGVPEEPAARSHALAEACPGWGYKRIAGAAQNGSSTR
jgi:hypothetical protein